MSARRAIVVLAAAGALLVANAPSTPALQHLMKVTEVFAGTSGQPNADMVELQMYSGNQNIVGGHKLELYAANGSYMDCTIPDNVTQVANQSYILFATSEMTAITGTPDFTIPGNFLTGDGGAVCFGNFDCVSWGTFPGAASATDTGGGPGSPEPGGIPADQSIHRQVGSDGLQASDDTNNSANDFAPGAESGTTSGVGNRGTLSCVQGTGGGGGGGGAGGGGSGGGVSVKNLKTKVSGNRATVSGRIQPADPGGTVRLSLKMRAEDGAIRLTRKNDDLNADSEFRKRFKVFPGPATCKLRVAYDGNAVARKTFDC